MIGEDATPDGIEQGSIFFFRLFLSCSRVDKLKGQKIKEMFGPFLATVVSQIAQQVQNVLLAIPALKDMLSPCDTSIPPTGPRHRIESVLNARAFGSDIPFKPVTVYYSDVTELHSDYSDEFSNVLSSLSREQGELVENGIEDELFAETQDLSSSFPPYWLLDQLKMLYTGTEAREKCGTVINLLSGPDGDDLIAEPLFDCLGDTGVELVHILLENRLVPPSC